MQDRAFAARRQAVAGPPAGRASRRRRDAAVLIRRGRPVVRDISAELRPRHQAPRGRSRRYGRARQARPHQDRRYAVQRQDRATAPAACRSVVGGAVPRKYFGPVQEGVVDGRLRGPLGFPVIDVQVTLIDGSYHSVDSSDLAFRTAARVGVSEGLPQCQPVLLEPIHLVEIVCPTEATAKINAILSGRRGQILGFDTREGWPGWDRVRAMMPEAEIGELIVELRSATATAGSFTPQFHPITHAPRLTPHQIITP